MYEFSNSEIKFKLKKTEYGKKVSKMLFVSVTISVVLFLISIILFVCISKGDKNLSITKNIFLNILFSITVMSMIVSCYFDGKRDGAIQQYKLGIKKKNSV